MDTTSAGTERSEAFLHSQVLLLLYALNVAPEPRVLVLCFYQLLCDLIQFFLLLLQETLCHLLLFLHFLHLDLKILE